jgi:transposase
MGGLAASGERIQRGGDDDMTAPTSSNATLRTNGNGATSQPSVKLGRKKRITGRGDLTDAEWALVEPLLPPERGREGRPASDNRVVVNGIVWHLRSRAPWREMPGRCGKWNSVYRRFSRWKQAGIWEPVARTLSQMLDRGGDCDCGCAEHTRPRSGTEATA